MNQLMTEVVLPPELALPQEHGRVSWAVKSIWEYYATWFHFDKTTELYPVAQDTIHADLVALAGADKIVIQARAYMDEGAPLKALHILDVLGNLGGAEALILREGALEELLVEAKSSHNNSYEIYWLDYKIRDVQDKLSVGEPE